MGKISCLIVGIVLVGNMFYTSGLAFRASGREMPDTPEMPYSPMLEELYGDFTEEDRACAEWLTRGTVGGVLELSFEIAPDNSWAKVKTPITSMNPMLPILGDYNAQCLLMGYDYDRQRVDYDYKYPHYLFLTEQNKKAGQMIYGRSPGLRFYKPIPDLSLYTLVISYNNSRIYIKE